MALFTMGKSILGRRLGLSSSGGLLLQNTTAPSTGFDIVALTRDSTGAVIGPHDEPVVTTTSTGGATLTFGGVVALNSSAVNPSFTITAPTAGRGMEFYFISTVSTTISFGGTSTSQVFQKLGGVSAGATIITFDNAAPSGNSFVLRGLSATKFGFLPGSTAAWT
jgi:hypothetical protein